MASSSMAVTSASLTAEDLEAREAELVVKFDEGTSCIKRNEIDDAVELFFEVLQARIELHGDLGLECASAYFKYGSCLFYKAQDEADFLGAPMQDAAKQRDGAMAGYETAPSEEQNVTIDDRGKGKVPMPDADVEEVEEGNGTEEGDADGGEDDDSEKTDMELAWENLETAKLIYNNNLQKLTDEQRLSLAEVHERLADLSMEKEDYETCMTDFKAALAMFVELLPACDRRLASLHFKMALALQFMDEPEVGLTHCQEALKLMESKLDELKNLVPEGDVEEKAADNPAEDIQGVLDDLRDKEVELKEVIAQNATTKELIKNAFAQFGGLGGGAATAANVVDLGTIGGSSGKKRVTPAPAAAAIPAAANTTPVEKGEEAPRQEKRKRTLEDLLAVRKNNLKVLGKLYSVMQSMENKLGGGEGVEGLYGSITQTGTQHILDAMALHSCLCEDSILVDVGAGLARPLLHACLSHKVAHAYGIEFDQVKCDKADAFGKRTLEEVRKWESSTGSSFSSAVRTAPVVLCAAIENVVTLDPATHGYSFWEGVCSDARTAFGRLFQSSSTMGSVTVVQRTLRAKDPPEFMASLGFGDVQLVATTSVSMSGSGRKFSAYTFMKTGWQPPCRFPGWVSTVSVCHSHRIQRTGDGQEVEQAIFHDSAIPCQAMSEDKSQGTAGAVLRQPKPSGPSLRQPTMLSAFRQTKNIVRQRKEEAAAPDHAKPGDRPSEGGDESGPRRSQRGRLIKARDRS